MSQDIVTCPSCGAQNSRGVLFCMNCGETLNQKDRDKALEDYTLGEPKEENPGLVSLQTQHLLETIVRWSNMEASRTNGGYRITVPLEGERRQVVHVVFNGKDRDGSEYISYLSLCGELRPGMEKKLLRLNSRLLYCACAIKDIKGAEHVVVTANQLARTADPEEVEKILRNVARKADMIEQRLSERDEL